MEIGIRILAGEIRHIDQLFDLNKAGVIDLDHIAYDDAERCYVVQVEGLRARYLLEVLLDGIDGRSFESFSEWERQHTSQLSLQLRTNGGDEHALEDGMEA